MRFILRMAISAVAIFGVAYLSEGMLLKPMEFWPTAVIAAVVLALVNAIVKPIVHLLSLPVTIVTLGLFALVINALMLYLVDWFVAGFDTVGFLQTVIAALLISIVTSVGSKLLDKED